MTQYIESNEYYTVYCFNDDIHRADGPARVWDYNGSWEWFLFDNWHRYYGVQSDHSRWYIHGVRVK